VQDCFQAPAWRADNNADLDLGSTGEAFGQNAVIGSSAYVACSSGLRQVHLG